MMALVPEPTRRKAVSLYQDGWSSRDVARKLGISHQTVLNLCREDGAEIRPRSQKRTDEEGPQ